MSVKFPEDISDDDFPTFIDDGAWEFRIRNDDRAFGKLMVPWAAKGHGFGEIFIQVKEGKFHIDNEGLLKNDVQDILKALVDSAVFIDEAT